MKKIFTTLPLLSLMYITGCASNLDKEYLLLSKDRPDTNLLVTTRKPVKFYKGSRTGAILTGIAYPISLIGYSIMTAVPFHVGEKHKKNQKF